MKINLLSSFSAGVLLSTAIISGVYFSGEQKDSSKGESTESSTNVQHPSEASMIQELESKGYVVISKDAYDQLQENKAAESKKTESDTDNQNKEKTKNEKKESSSSPKKEKISITVKEGMTSYDIGKKLKEAGFIKMEPLKFSREVEKRGIATRLQLGTYTVTSSMSFEEILDMFFK